MRFFVLSAPLPSMVSASTQGTVGSPTSVSSAGTGSVTGTGMNGTGNGNGAGINAGTALAPSYLHMFKSSSPDEREIERLEINEESAVYVADGEVGGRKCVVKVEGVLRRRPLTSGSSHSGSHFGGGGGSAHGHGFGGTGAGAGAGGSGGSGTGNVAGGKEAWAHAEDGPAGSEEGRTTWIVQIVDGEESSGWVGAVKGVVLNQRYVPSHLCPPYSLFFGHRVLLWWIRKREG